MIRHGCINWDSANPDTYFGNYTLQALKAFPERLPFYVNMTENGYSLRERTQEDYDRELQYAIDAGIDFFAHCWYTRHVIDGDDLGEHVHELTQARFLHMKSHLREKIKMCAIITAHKATDEDYKELAEAMKEDYYEKTPDGRPLVFVFNVLSEDSYPEICKMLKAAESVGLRPYVVGLNIFSNMTISEKHGEVLSKLDAISTYADVNDRINTFSELIDGSIYENAHRATRGKTVFPHFTSGWDPTPRIKNPVPWVTYKDVSYARPATPEELIEGAVKFKKWLDENENICNNDFVLTFAWNEFEEGGWICPTLNPDGSANTERVHAFARISEIFNR